MKSLTALVVALLLAIFLWPSYAADDISQIHACTQLFAGRTAYGPSQKGVAQLACLWKTKTLKVRFLEGHPVVREKVQKIAMEWVQYSGIQFVFGDFPDAQIRISFKPSGSWSYVGSCQYDLKPTEATMNFGWLYPLTPDAEYRRVVLHEFGHALGMVHEHQNPAGNIPWNEQAVYEYYQRQGWDKEKTYYNVIRKYSEEETNHTKYDPDSIMQYPIPKELSTNGFEVGWNSELSAADKEFMRQQYRRN
jgi:hypothetical protein